MAARSWPGLPFGGLLRQNRQRLDLTIENLAERSRVSDRTISDLERGVSTGPQRRTVLALADVLDLVEDDREEFLAAARAGRRGGTAFSEPEVSAEPHRVSDFSGRSTELSIVTALLASEVSGGATRVLVSGPPGVGKTTIAVEALHHSRERFDAQLFADLRGLDVTPRSPLQVLQALLAQLGIGHESAKTVEEASRAWRSATESAAVAVLLDNASAESQVRPVLSATSARVVVTSRRTLTGVEGIRRITLGSLSRQESTRFLQRLIPEHQRAHDDLGELAQLCDDLPLALRIAGARIASRPRWTVEDYARRLRSEGDRLRNLVAGDLGVESAFSLSYGSLGRPARELFRSLSVLHGTSFSAAMAGAIDGLDPADAQDLLDGLVDLGLVETLSGDRYRVHDLLRLYAEARRGEEETEEEARAQHRRLRRWTLDAAAAAARTMFPGSYYDEPWKLDLSSPASVAAQEWLVVEADYWIAALEERGDDQLYTEVVATARSLRPVASFAIAWGRWHDVYVAASDAAAALGDRAATAELLQYLSILALTERFDPRSGRRVARRALGAAAGGDVRMTGLILGALAWAELQLGNAESAAATALDAIQVFADRDLPSGEIRTRSFLVQALLTVDPAESLAEAHRLADSMRALGPDLTKRVWTADILAAQTGIIRTLLGLGLFDEALASAEEMVAYTAPMVEHPDFLARALRHRGFAHLGLGHHGLAATDLRSALELAGPIRPDWWADEIDETLAGLPSG